MCYLCGSSLPEWGKEEEEEKEEKRVKTREEQKTD